MYLLHKCSNRSTFFDSHFPPFARNGQAGAGHYKQVVVLMIIDLIRYHIYVQLYIFIYITPFSLQF
jgi:hypothetical protein